MSLCRAKACCAKGRYIRVKGTFKGANKLDWIKAETSKLFKNNAFMHYVHDKLRKKNRSQNP